MENITRPFHYLLMHPTTNWTVLKSAFSKLYSDLTETSTKKFLTLNKVVTFVSDEMFEASLPQFCLQEKLNEEMQLYSTEIESLLGLALKMFAE